MKQKYEAAEGSNFNKKDVQKYGERLEYLSSKGNLTPAMVVNDGGKISSPFF